ncbi:MAG TPA: hypothetical protein VMJ10_24080 [Kofleriaceae bacterium]|nr:hypothetical protein [Kofleriaceae bacterium]
MQPAPGPYAYGNQPARPGAPRTLGILSIIFGSLITFTSLLGIAGKQLGAAMQQNERSREAFEQFSGEIHGWSVGVACVMAAMSIALLVIGIGQRGYKSWAARASVTWGAVALLVLVAQAVLQFTVMMPAMEHFMQSIPNPADVPMGPIMKVSAIIGLLFYTPYPIILIVSFRKPHIVAAMQQ